MKKFARNPTSKPYGKILLSLRWAILVFGLLVSLFELSENTLTFDPRVPNVVVFGLIVPVVGWLLLTMVARSMMRQADSESKFQRHQQFVQGLEHCQGWNELTRFIVEFPNTLLCVDHTSLYLYDQRHARIKFAAEWNAVGAARSPVSRYLASSSICANCLATKSPQLRNTAACAMVSGFTPGVTSEYCLPLTYDKLLVGTLRMRCPADQALEPEQVDFLHAVAPEIALALAVCIAQPRQVRHIQLEAQLDERRTIAYDLHNSLAQQAGYLRLSLDRLSSDPDLLMADDVRGELRQMRDVADEVYKHIRNSLAGLRSQDLSDLTTTITHYAGIVARRADLSIEVQTTGTPAVLPPACNQQVFSLLREGLNNIEKHAHARQVQLQLNWSAEELCIELLDDGIGFDQIALADGHYGLIMIREQVTEMGGEVYVESTLGRGTRLKFLIPLAWMLARQPLWQSGSLVPQELE